VAVVVCAMGLAAVPSFAQHPAPRAGGHPGVARPATVRPPRAPVTSFHSSVSPFHVYFPATRRHRFRFFPIWPGFFGLGYGSYWLPSCDGYWGWGYSCGAFSPYYSYAPEPAYPPDGYESESPTGESLGVDAALGDQLPRKILLYLKNGSVFGVASYTVSDGKLHYVTGYGGQNDIDLDLLDVQKTIDENAARGITFSLTPPNPPPDPTTPPKQ
jgi:hypothetical protein